MRLHENKAVLTQKNEEEKLQGDSTCYFCDQVESVDHLFFGYVVAKVGWGIVASCFNSQIRPASYEQFWIWISQVLPGGDQFYRLVLAAICWATWKARSKACFDKVIIRYPCDIKKFSCFHAILVRSLFT